MDAGRIRCMVENDSLEAEPGDTIVTPAGAPHAFEVLDGAPSQVVCVVCPPPDTEK
jgi:quercetin dioxygenase-like cupin family protein